MQLFTVFFAPISTNLNYTAQTFNIHICTCAFFQKFQHNFVKPMFFSTYRCQDHYQLLTIYIYIGLYYHIYIYKFMRFYINALQPLTIYILYIQNIRLCYRIYLYILYIYKNIYISKFYLFFVSVSMLCCKALFILFDGRRMKIKVVQA